MTNCILPDLSSIYIMSNVFHLELTHIIKSEIINVSDGEHLNENILEFGSMKNKTII